MSATPFRVAPPCSDAVLQAQNGCDNRSGQRCAVPGGGHRDRPVGLPIDIVGGAIDGVDHPEDVRAVGQTAGLCRGALLAEETIGGTGDEQCLTNGVLGCAIGAGDQVGVARLCEARRGVGPHFGLRGRRHLSPDPGHGQGNLGQVDCCWGVCGLRGFGAGRTHEPPTHSRHPQGDDGHHRHTHGTNHSSGQHRCSDDPVAGSGAGHSAETAAHQRPAKTAHHDGHKGDDPHPHGGQGGQGICAGWFCGRSLGCGHRCAWYP